MVASANASHIGSSLSCIDILAVLYSGAAAVSPDNATNPLRDIVILSKGHAAAGLYATLAHAGFFEVGLLDTFCRDGGNLYGHVTSGIAGVEHSTGSLGHGLAFGSGIALADLRDGSPRRVFVVLSDGECDEGSVWEAAMFAAHHGLAGLTAIIDRNGMQSFGSTESTCALEPFADKWRSFGWSVTDVDGHDHMQLRNACESRPSVPHVIIARTVKGKGVTFMEGNTEWHYRAPDRWQLDEALRQIAAADA
jgi:transketolase